MRKISAYRFPIILFIVVACSFLLMVWASGRTSLWNDEFATIDSLQVDQSFHDFLVSNVNNGFTGVNFSYVLQRIWFQIVPFGDNWLLLISNLAACVALVFTGLAGRLLKGSAAGILSCIFLATSHAMIVYCATEFRYYGFTLMFAAMVMYFYIKRNQKYPKISGKNTILFGIVMGLLVNVQVLSAPVLIAPFLCDILFFIRKKISAWALLPYLIACLFVFPGYFIRIALGQGAAGSLWNPNMAPTFANALNIVSGELLDASSLRVFCYLLGLAVALVLVIRVVFVKTSSNRREALLLSVVAGTPLINIGLLLLLSRTVEGYMIFMTRYISWTLPFIAAASAIGVFWLLEKAVSPENGSKRVISAVICCVLFLYLFQLDVVRISDNPGVNNYQKEVVQWISEHEEVYAQDACVVWGDWWVKGIKDYYFDKQGLPAPGNMMGLQQAFGEEGPFSGGQVNRIYFVIADADMNDEMNAAWEANGYAMTETVDIEWIPRIHIWERSR
jgi:hypothetical protein